MQETMQMPVQPVVRKRGRTEENLKFANDGSLESVDALLHKLAAKCYARVQAMSLPMDYDDVVQEMRLTYVKVKKTWNPQGTALFSTYCTFACMNNFNAAILKMARDRKEMGMVPVESICSEGSEDQRDVFSYMANAACSKNTNPEHRLESAQEMTRNLAMLSATARQLVRGLLASERRLDDESPATLRSIAVAAEIRGPELRRVKLEIFNKFGVSWY